MEVHNFGPLCSKMNYDITVKTLFVTAKDAGIMFDECSGRI